MAQAGLHAIVGAAVRKWAPNKEWLMMGIIIGNLFPDLDNIAVAVATVMKVSTDGLHRTFTHSIFTVALLMAIFYIIGNATKKPAWTNFGIGFSVGILMHILLDFVLWFNGVEFLWPIRYKLNFWQGFVVPGWLDKLLMTAEFLFFGLFFLLLVSMARKKDTNTDYAPKVQNFANIQFGLFFLFTVLAFTGEANFKTMYGAVYLLALIFTIIISFRMKKTIEAV